MKNQNSYHNTVGHTGEKLQSHELKAYSQDQVIADFFTTNPGTIWTPWEVQAMAFNIPRPPITSIRRAMSNLTRDGILTKTDKKKVVGVYGHTSYSWTINQSYYETLMAMDIVFSPKEPTEGVRMGDLLEPILEGAKKIKPQDEPKKSPQGKLFEVAPMDPTHCILCGKLLTDPKSIVNEMGPVCSEKCRQSIETLGPKGKMIRDEL